MNRELLNTKVNQARREATAASLWLEDAFMNYHYKRGQLAALENLLRIAENRIEKNVETQN